MVTKILKYLLVIALGIILAALALFKWESSETNVVLVSTIESMVTGKMDPDIEIVFQENVTIPELSREYEIINSDNLLLWGYEYRIKFHSGHEVGIDVVPQLFNKPVAYVYFGI